MNQAKSNIKTLKTAIANLGPKNYLFSEIGRKLQEELFLALEDIGKGEKQNVSIPTKNVSDPVLPLS